MTPRQPGPSPDFLRLMEKFCQLGRLLPPRGEIDTAVADEQSRADMELVLAEMAVVKAEIDGMLAAARTEAALAEAERAAGDPA